MISNKFRVQWIDSPSILYAAHIIRVQERRDHQASLLLHLPLYIYVDHSLLAKHTMSWYYDKLVGHQLACCC